MPDLKDIVSLNFLEEMARQFETDPEMRALYRELSKNAEFNEEVDADYQEILDMLAAEEQKR